MNVCSRCKMSYNDGVQCSSCKSNYDFGCSGITEQGYRKLGADRRASWRCASCRGTSPVRGEETVSLDRIFNEILDMKRQLTNLPALLDEVKCIKNELQDLRASCEFNSSKLDECTTRIEAVEARLPEVNQLREELAATQDDLVKCRHSLATKEQWLRLNNAEIKGVPTKKDENLFDILDSIGKFIKCPISKTYINHIARVPQHNSKEKSIIVSFTNRYMKEEFVAAARSMKNLKSSDFGFRDSTQRVFVNDHLTTESKNLLTKTKSVLKDKMGYRYVWVKYSKIHVRQNDISKIFIINSESDLNRLS
ncbi:uncharacterized protein LOC132904303 [Amyelois transitella]|uniref:uncharacterized protein LOC132904303 n=1 Tax=Amyelois transitella TaxID=680683 RepID=UPI0029902DAC|nr:uncharacterized protein LOC132904303 [Amyelois transitella]